MNESDRIIRSRRDAGSVLIVGLIAVIILAGLASALVGTNVSESTGKREATTATLMSELPSAAT